MSTPSMAPAPPGDASLQALDLDWLTSRSEGGVSGQFDDLPVVGEPMLGTERDVDRRASPVFFGGLSECGVAPNGRPGKLLSDAPCAMAAQGPAVTREARVRLLGGQVCTLRAGGLAVLGRPAALLHPGLRVLFPAAPTVRIVPMGLTWPAELVLLTGITASGLAVAGVLVRPCPALRQWALVGGDGAQEPIVSNWLGPGEGLVVGGECLLTYERGAASPVPPLVPAPVHSVPAVVGSPCVRDLLCA